MAKLNLRDALNTSLTRTKQYIDTELAKKANSSHGTHVTYGGNGSATTVSRSDHTHSYVPLATGSSITIHADSDSSSTGEYLLLKGGHNELKIASNAGGSTVTKSNTSLTFNGNVVYHAGNKPTPADIGAAPTSHASTATTYGAASASNYGHAMASSTTPKANGTAAVGSETAKFARGDHVHPLQTTVSGNAGTATKLATARKINGTSFDGSADITTANWGTTRKINQVSVNGSADVKLPLDYYTCNIGSSNAKPYHHILTTGQCTGSYTDKSITIVLVNHYNSAGLGIAKATLRTNDAANGATASGELRWLVRSGFAEDQLCFNIRNTAKDAYMDVFYKATGTYNSLTWYVLTEGVRGSHGAQWTKYNTHHDNGTNVYNETGMKAIRSYTATLQLAADHGAVNSAKTAAACSGNATTATKLATARTLTIGSTGKTFDGSGNVSWSLSEIGAAAASHGTHVSYGGNGSATTVSRSDHTHSYLPLGGGTMTGNIKFTDVTSTTYPAKSAMLTWNGSTDGADIYYQVDASDKGRLVLNTRDDADCVIAFANKGTIVSTIDNSGNFSGKAATATKATQDSAGQQINTTYIKGLSVSGKTITYTKGDGTTGTITTQDTNTTYSTGTASALGLTKLYTGTGTATDGTMTQSAIKSALDGKSNTSHTHNYAGSSSAGGAANSVKTNLIIKLNGGTTEGTNLFTFNGSAAKTVNITPSAIGAAASSHTHNQINSRGNVTCETGTNRPATAGLSMAQAYNNGYPINYGNIINLKGQGDGQILVGWSGTSGAHAPVYVRSKRDTSDANWSGWAQIYTSANPQTTINGLSFWTGTQEQYDALSSKSSTTVYIIK